MAHHWTWQKLAQNAYRLNPKSRGPKYPYTPKFEFGQFSSGQNKDQKVVVPYKGTSSLLISMRAWGVTQSSLHNVTMLFHDVDILTENPNNTSYFQVQYDGVMYWCKKLDRTRNPLTSRCTCFTGDTEILLADGTSKTFKELEGKEFDILSYNQDADKFETVHAFNCEKKKENAELLKITLDDGTEIKCTRDHKFLTRKGHWIKAENLLIGESLRAFYGNTTSKKGLIRKLPNNHTQKIQPHKAEEKFYLYVYLDPRYPGKYEYTTCSFDYKPIYVGKGCRNRYLKHLNSKLNDPFHNTLRKLKSLNLEPIILKQKENLTESVAYRLEQELTEEIGLVCENKGTLLNLKHGGEGGLSGIAKTHTQEYMLNNNPMFNPEIAKKVSEKNEQNGNHEKFRKLFRENNPSHNPKSVAKGIKTKLERYTPEERSNIAKKAAASRSPETFKKISESLRNSEVAKKLHYENGKKLGQLAKQRAAEGKLHTQTDEWREFTSKHSKKLWENPEYKQKMSQVFKEIHAEKRQKRVELTENQIDNIINQNGWFNRDLYQKTENNYSLNMLRSECYFIVRKCYEKVYGVGCNIKKIENTFKKQLNPKYVNHKVVKIEPIENDDVYCLTTEYLGNFVIKATTQNDIISGVVVANCKDYFFTAAWYNSKNGCLYGKIPRPYIRKTQNYPERNKLHAPIICKHVYNAWAVLKNSGLTVN